MFKIEKNSYQPTFTARELNINEDVLNQVVGNNTQLKNQFCCMVVRLNGAWKNHGMPDEEILDAQEAIAHLRSDATDMAVVLDQVDLVLQAFDLLSEDEKLYRQDRLLILAFISGAEQTGTALLKKLNVKVDKYSFEQKAQYLSEVACSGNKEWFLTLLNEMKLTEIPDRIYRNLNQIGRDLVATVRMDRIANEVQEEFVKLVKAIIHKELTELSITERKGFYEKFVNMLSFSDDEIKDASGMQRDHIYTGNKEWSPPAEIDTIAKTTERKLQLLVRAKFYEKTLSKLSYLERKTLYEDFAEMLDLTENDFKDNSNGLSH